jgi:DNA-damage-inducible protein D
MTTDDSKSLALFGQQTIRRVWHKDEWYYSIVDVIAVLTDSSNPRNYWNMLKARAKSEGFDEAMADIVPLKLKSADNRFRLTETANRTTLLRIIQSIPSPRAEPFRLWLAQVGEERLEEIENPEAAIERVRELYRARGHDESWIEARIRNDLARNELTDEWCDRGAKEGVEYAILTNEISEGTFNLTVQAYKQYKLLPKSTNLRDHMTTMELVLCSLGEATATLYHRNRDSQGFPQLKRDAHDAGVTAGKARQVIEADLGESVVSQSNHLALPGPPRRTKRDPKLKSSTKQQTGQPAPRQQGDETQLSLFDDAASEETTPNREE